MRYKILTFLILNNLLFASDGPVLFPFLSNSKPHYLEKLGTFNFFSKEKFKFGIEFGSGTFGNGEGFALLILPFPSISGYFKFTHKNFGFSISIFDRYQYVYQYVIRDKVWGVDEQGRIYKATYYNLDFIYSARIGFSCNPIQKFVFNIAKDVNYGFKQQIFKSEIFDTSLTYQDFSLSYSFGILYFENPKTNFYIQYDSRVKVKYEEYENLFIPSQISVSFNFPFSQNLNIGIKNFIKYDKFNFYKNKKYLINTFDMAYDFLTSPFIKNTSFYFSLYTFPLVYYSSSKGFSFIFGPKFYNFL